jgi:hypothetical protein
LTIPKVSNCPCFLSFNLFKTSIKKKNEKQKQRRGKIQGSSGKEGTPCILLNLIFFPIDIQRSSSHVGYHNDVRIKTTGRRKRFQEKWQAHYLHRDLTRGEKMELSKIVPPEKRQRDQRMRKN